MATLALCNVPDDLVARLKVRTKRHRRSLNNETIAVVELADAAKRELFASLRSQLKGALFTSEGLIAAIGTDSHLRDCGHLATAE